MKRRTCDVSNLGLDEHGIEWPDELLLGKLLKPVNEIVGPDGKVAMQFFDVAM